MKTTYTPVSTRHKSRLVSYISWGSIGVEEMTASLDGYNEMLQRLKIPARLAFAGTWYDDNAVKIAVRFNGEDIAKVCDVLGLTAGELLSGDVGLAMGMD
jgi:hypothetical protein